MKQNEKLTPENLMSAIGGLGEDLIVETDALRNANRNRHKKWHHAWYFTGVAAAACFVIVIGYGISNLHMGSSDMATFETAEYSMDSAAVAEETPDEEVSGEETEEALTESTGPSEDVYDDSAEESAIANTTGTTAEEDSTAKEETAWLQSIHLTDLDCDVYFTETVTDGLGNAVSEAAELTTSDLLDLLCSNPDVQWTIEWEYLSDLTRTQIFESIEKTAKDKQCSEVLSRYIK